jgi:hypothetical protein
MREASRSGVEKFVSVTEVIVQYDSIEPDTIPADPPAVAGYVAGRWPDYSELVARFPRARHKSIAVAASEDADILDIENGDASPSDGPGWFTRQRARGLQLPGFYADASTMPEVVAALAGAGIERTEYVLWVAWYNGSDSIVPGYEAHQWTDSALGRNLDQSSCLPSFWAPSPSPAVRNDVDYSWFATGPFPSRWGKLDERAVVQAYDGARRHPGLHWLKLRRLRAQLRFLADRVRTEAERQALPSGRPSWDRYHRGWRFQQLIHRAQNQRFT